MSGRLTETNYSSLKEQKKSDQSSLSNWGDDEETYIAVVSLPRGGIEDIVDEVWPELGMPEGPLKKFLAVRAGYKTNSAIDDAHNQAYEDSHLTEIYHKHLGTERAQMRLQEAVERLISGENITLVCYEEEGDSCHRHILIDELTERVERRESCKFTLSA